MSDESVFTQGSGNVYADLGLPNPEERKTKAELAYRIGRTIAARDLTEPEVVSLLDIGPEEISSLLRGRLSGFSVEHLLHFLTVLGHSVRIEVLPPSELHEQGHITVAD